MERAGRSLEGEADGLSMRMDIDANKIWPEYLQIDVPLSTHHMQAQGCLVNVAVLDGSLPEKASAIDHEKDKEDDTNCGEFHSSGFSSACADLSNLIQSRTCRGSARSVFKTRIKSVDVLMKR